MNLHDWALDHLERIKDWVARVGEGGRVNYHADKAGAVLLNPVYHLVFGIGLPEIQRKARGFCFFPTHRFDVTNGRVPVDFRLTRSEHVEVGSVQDEDRVSHGSPIASDREVAGLGLDRDPAGFREAIDALPSAKAAIARSAYPAEWHLGFIVHGRAIYVTNP